MIRVLVVDDSAFMRNAISSYLTQDAGIEVVGTARDGVDCLEKVKQLQPDVITLDLEMPRMDGLETLKQLMSTTPLPVIMISSLTEFGAEATLKAMEAGAMDFIPKTMANDKEAFGDEIRRKVKLLARRKAFIRLKYSAQRQSRKPSPLPSTPAPTAAPHTSRFSSPTPPSPPRSGSSLSRPAGTGSLHGGNFSSGQGTTTATRAVQTSNARCRGARDIVVIGVSTGGPPVVQKILSALPANLSACILVAQHMPASFTGPFAKRLDGVCALSVTEAVNGDKLVNGHVYICPGGRHIGIQMRGPLAEVLVTDEPKSALYKPTVNLLMETAGKCMGRRVLGVMLTGMGSDGVDGARVLKEKGGWLIAQSEATCVVYGMPKAVVDAGLADQVVDADDIAEQIIAAVKG